MLTDALKGAIFDKALRGQLIPQNSDDEPASVLLKKIISEKHRLKDAGLIKKDGLNSVIKKEMDGRIYEEYSGVENDITDEIAFDLPCGWEYIRLVDVCWLYDVKESKNGELLPYLDVKTLRSGSIHDVVSKGKVINAGDRVILVDGENSGEVFVVPFKGYMGSTFRLLGISEYISNQFLNIVLDCYRQKFRTNKVGSAIPHLDKALFKSILIGLPPYPEQERIVSKVEELHYQLKHIEKKRAQLLENALVLEDKIYNLAIRGKLVSQNYNDEPATILIDKICTERKVKLGKKYTNSCICKENGGKIYEYIGKEKKDITDEMLFEIPESWEWARLGDLFEHNTGKALNSSNQSGHSEKYITTSNVYWNHFVLDTLKEMRFTESEIEKCTVRKGDLLVCEGGDFGRAAIWDYDYNICIQNHIHRLIPYGSICVKFYYYVLYIYKHSGWIKGNGIGLQGLSSNVLHNMLVPVPPLAEQESIVSEIEKYEHLFEKFNSLE